MTLARHKRALIGFGECAAGTEALAKELGVPFGLAAVHTFPDGETLVTVPFTAAEAVLYRPLQNPNAKIFEVIQAASALRDSGALKIPFVCPYLPYMRQDKVFRAGQSLSQAVFGKVVAPWVDAIIAVEPHLHRTRTMGEVFEGIEGRALSGGLALAGYYRAHGFAKETLVLGPDAEAWHTAKPFAEALGLEWTTAEKKRRGDREVEVAVTGAGLTGRPVIIVDDVVSSGMTVIGAAAAAFARGAKSVEVAAVHALYDKKAGKAFADAGITSVISCDGVPHPSNRVPLAPLIAKALAG